VGVGVAVGVGVGGRGVLDGGGVLGGGGVMTGMVGLRMGESIGSVSSGVGVKKDDGTGVSVGGGGGVGVSWTKMPSVEEGEASAPKTGDPDGAGGADRNSATAPTANSVPARSTAPNASSPVPPPPCGSAVSALRYATPAPRPAAVGSRNPHFAQYAELLEFRVPQFGQFKLVAPPPLP
jgi:hypothetical protein